MQEQGSLFDRLAQERGPCNFLGNARPYFAAGVPGDKEDRHPSERTDPCRSNDAIVPGPEIGIADQNTTRRTASSATQAMSVFYPELELRVVPDIARPTTQT
jgi:hypothetical protein